MARPNAYDTKIKPRFEEIEKWLELGASEKEIIENLGVSESTYFKYKAERVEFTEFLKKGRKKPVQEIKAAMLKSAKGFQYNEKKVIKQQMDLPDELQMILVDNGVNVRKLMKPVLVRTEETTKTALPNVAAGLILLQHWAKDEGWTRDPQNLELKKEELEFKKKQAEENAW